MQFHYQRILQKKISNYDINHSKNAELVFLYNNWKYNQSSSIKPLNAIES